MGIMGLELHYSKERQQAERDAEYILETIMHRQRWDVGTRDKLADALEAVKRGEKLRTTSKPRRRVGRGVGSSCGGARA